ncbi:NAD(P)H-dependent oxidoreductase [Alkalimonas collagenimarina]|uniref:FMN dependent NADH:quinone oxidoreductase n=1 Tax=Alkalimonas collagenimarina TaxID=400390 RepID=A0ABT9GZE5_9GAMM|nr:NAD(P)H-dependent oxidoreductase [Alkalimonas collagenimarina]MDP4536435.1 NAD(P)H-dependent oxidoreductase [Alkalimonas collagenimarina]
MKNVLVIESSISGKNGQSSQLIAEFTKNLAPDVRLDRIDLQQQPLPHLDMPEIAAWMTPVEDRTPEQQALASHSDQLIERVKQADAIVLGVPMYNFGVPSQLKALFDRIARAGLTFKYTENGSVGLLDNKPVFIFATRGGFYQGTNADNQTPYLEQFFKFIGLTEQYFIYAEGLNMGEESAEKAFTAAKNRIDELTKKLAA